MGSKDYFSDAIEPGTYNIGYMDCDQNETETQFFAETVDDLAELWLDFCKEDDIGPDNIRYVENERTFFIQLCDFVAAFEEKECTPYYNGAIFFNTYGDDKASLDIETVGKRHKSAIVDDFWELVEFLKDTGIRLVVERDDDSEIANLSWEDCNETPYVSFR